MLFRSLYYHRKILDAIINRDVPLAENLMEEHIEVTIQRLKSERDEDLVSAPDAGAAKPGGTNGFKGSNRTSGLAPVLDVARTKNAPPAMEVN